MRRGGSPPEKAPPLIEDALASVAVWLAVIALDVYLLAKEDNDEEELASPD